MSTNLAEPKKQENLPAKTIIANVLLWVLYAFVVCFTALHHEPWCDEADSWLYARDESLSTILSRTGYMGTPALWYFTLFPLAKAGLPYAAMTGINVVFALLSAGLIVFRSPFSFLLRALICFSYLFVFEYSVIARSYGISVLIILSLAALYQRRQAHPLFYTTLIALLANTNVHSLIVSIGITAAFLLTNWRKGWAHLAPILIAIVGIGLSVLQLLPPADGQFQSALAIEWWKQPVLSTFKGAFFPDPATSIDHWSSPPALSAPISLAFKLITFALIFLILKKIWPNRFALLTFVFSYLGLFSLFAFKYYGSVRHWGFFVLVSIFCLWIQAEDGKTSMSKKLDLALSSLLLLSFGYSSAIGLYACATDIKRPFSSGAEIAKQLKVLNPQNDPVVSYPNCGLSTLPYAPGLQLFYPTLNQYGTHAMWNHAEKETLTAKRLREIIDKQFGAQKKIYLLTDKDSPALLQEGFKFVYKNEQPPITSSENLFIYTRN